MPEFEFTVKTSNCKGSPNKNFSEQICLLVLSNDFVNRVINSFYLHVVVDFKSVVEVKEVLHLVVGNAAIDHRLLARVHDDERQLREENIEHKYHRRKYGF